MVTSPKHGTVPTTLPQSHGVTSSSTISLFLLSHFISLAHFFSQLRGKGIINLVVLTSCTCG